MHVRMFLTTTVAIILMSGCSGNKPATNTGNSRTDMPVDSKIPGPLPDRGFKAQITLLNLPAKLRTGQKETITLRIKNASDVMWWLRGGETNTATDNKFYIAAGNRWLDKDGKRTSEMEGHNAIPKDLRPGEETEMTLQITAPQQPGEYTLEVDMVQEQIAWFGDKGSPTARAKVTVVR